MTVFGYVSVASLVATAALALYVMVRGPRSVSTFPFALLRGTFSAWALSESILRLSLSSDPAALLIWARIEWVAIAFTSGPFLHFVLNFATGRPLRERQRQVPGRH